MMAREVAVITVHGMGTTPSNYYEPFERKLRRSVGADTWERVHFEPVYYQGLLQGNQQDVWEKMRDEYDLRWDFLRKFMLFSFSDAAAIEHSLRSVNQALYQAVHQTIAMAFDTALAALGSDPSRPVILVAHSLGCEQASNYIWDAGTNERVFASDSGTPEQKQFRRLNSCSHFITTGCNIPIFKAGLDDPKLFTRPNASFEWHNYFDKDDVLGYPMKPMGPAFKQVDWLHDHSINVGGFLTGWNPVSHTKYWTDKDLVNPIRDIIQGHLNP